MNDFVTIFKKELKELINKQLIFSLLFMVLVLVFMGNVIGDQVEKESEIKIAVLDLDKTKTSRDVKNILAGKGEKKSLLKIELTDIEKTKDIKQSLEITKEKELTNLILIENGFEKKLKNKKITEIKIYSIISGFNMGNAISGSQIESVIDYLNYSLSRDSLSDLVPEEKVDSVLNPISIKNFLEVKGGVVEGNPAMIMSLMTSQGIFIPMVLMMVIIYCGTMIINSMGLEKENKTLETLLTLPINRISIIAGKMAGAATVGFLMAAVYMIGFSYYMGAMNPDELGGVESLSLEDFGLQMGIAEYIVLGISLFLAILVALALSMLLGIFSEDTKSAQTMIMPIMVLVMVPSMLLMFQDASQMPLAMKIVLYIIPFSHPILASRALLFGDYLTPFFGILYLIVIFAATLFVILKIFNTDKILTAKFSFGKKHLRASHSQGNNGRI